ncbi:MAG: hypothetical protein J1F33_04645 [Clostridiales bacterium]|nr:hypothetical protein [Clostridiales bacterium]
MKLGKSALKRIKESIERKTKEALAELRAKNAAEQKTKKPAAERKPKKAPAKKTKKASDIDGLELLFIIVNRSKGEFYADLMESFEVNMLLTAHGTGTADKSTLELFGLNDTDKAVILGVIRKSKIADALYTLDQKFKTIRNGKGIAYTVPLTGVIGTLIFGFLSNNRKMVKENTEESKK